MSKGKAQIIGWRYFLGMHMVLCHGPVDAVQAISFGEREAWSGSRVGSGDILVNNPKLFVAINARVVLSAQFTLLWVSLRKGRMVTLCRCLVLTYLRTVVYSA